MAASGGEPPVLSPFDLSGLSAFLERVNVSAREDEAERVRKHEKELLTLRQKHQLTLLSWAVAAVAFLALEIGSFLMARYSPDAEIRKLAAGLILPGFTALLGFFLGKATGGGKGGE